MLVGSPLLLSGLWVFVFRAQPRAEGHMWWFLEEEEEGKTRADFAVQLMPVPAGCLGKPGQRLLVF